MNVVDSSAWLEYFANGPNASYFAPAVEDVGELLVPSLTISEVFRRVFQQAGESQALNAVAAMQQGRVVDLDERIALSAARVSLECKLPLADSIVLATARAFSATVWTQDEDFKGLPDVRYRRKKS